MSVVSTAESVVSDSFVAVSEELPRLSADLQFGPPEFLAGHVMQLAKDVKTGRYFRLGEREMFILECLDNQCTRDSLLAGYHDRFGRALSPESLYGALCLFAGRGFLVDFDTPAVCGEVVSHGPSEFLSKGLFSSRVLSWDPNDWIGGIVKYFRWLINGPVLVIWAFVILAAEAVVLLHSRVLWQELFAQPAGTWPGRMVAIAVIGSVIMNFHEFGHALACKRYGGAVPEMGYLFRYLSFCAFTKIDDILLFKNRLHRVHVLVIGPLISLSAIPIAVVMWLQSQPATFPHRLATDVLVLYNCACFAQLIPFLQLDGYFILAQLLQMPDLRKDSYTYLTRGLLSLVTSRKPMPIAREHRRYLVPIYITYGLTSLLATTCVLAFLLIADSRQIVQTIGVTWSIVLASAALLFATWRIYSVTLPWLQSVLRNDSPKGSL